ncbi:JmjC domain-containing protein [Amycolatopsis sp. PS_44_ISF1]|uniref:cupin domain-containing protein n=1 Tax=Amycolatopsis sp. PS_44_ISF1 TaxID=2974917 RepID=UPI0028DE258C|nr:cupin domain-containing protein [Amycolatopsis sp. PS_44_ISF1]MDT8915174.1 cupin domain-containing protein [Amycolatopsis sp. PS_44_ISF1]
MGHADLSGPAAGAGTSAQAVPAPVGAGPAGGALERLVGPDVPAFAEEHWSRKPLLRRGADRTGFRDLIDLDDVDELLSRRGLRTPFLRMARNGQLIDSGSFTGGAGVGAEIGDQVRDDRVAALFAEGSTIVLQALHRTWPGVLDFVVDLSDRVGHPVQANAYLTPPSSQGFSAHYDVHDVFVLQLAGRKHWTVHAPVHPAPLRSQPWTEHREAVTASARDDAPAIDSVLEPGDVMYLPRGWLHSAVALGGVSAHLTLGVHVVTQFALVEALTSLVSSDERLRASLPLGVDVADPAQLAPQLDHVRSALIEAVRRVSPEDVARRVRGRVWSGRRPEPIGPLAAAAFAGRLEPGDVVRLRAGLGHRLVPGKDSVVLELPDRQLSLPTATGEALRAVLNGAAWPVGRLPGLDEPDQVVLVRRLLREGVLVAATP